MVRIEALYNYESTQDAVVTPRLRYAVYGVFAVSGAVALVYQVLWMRWLTFIFGYTTASVSIVLTTFMAGFARRAHQGTLSKLVEPLMSGSVGTGRGGSMRAFLELCNACHD
jgi:hypothetical protein